MKTITVCLSLGLALTNCGGSPPTADVLVDSTATSTPSDVTQKFNSLIGEFEQKISNDFWTDDNFDMDAYAGYMKQKGLNKIPNSLMDYSGVVNDVTVTVLHKTASGEKGGWVQQFTVMVQDSIFAKQKEFAVTR